MGKRPKHSPRIVDERERLYFDRTPEDSSRFDKHSNDNRSFQRWSPKDLNPYESREKGWLTSLFSSSGLREKSCSGFIDFWRNPGNSVARQLYKASNFVDFYHSYDDVPSAGTVNVDATNWQYWLLLCLMGALTGIICFVLDIYNEAVALLLREELIEGEYFFLTLLFSLVSAFIAVACCHRWAPQAVGSGIPQMKVILNGGSLRDFLSLRTLLAKCLGLAAAITAGLHIGKEGPYVHIAAIVAALLLRLKMFRGLITSPSCRTAILAAAVGAGVTASFGSPIGGLLLSIEVTATFFMGHSLLRSYLCCGVCYLTFKFLRVNGEYVDLFSMKTDTTWEMSSEVVIFAIIGVCGGLLGGLFLLCVEAVNRYTETHKTLRDKLAYVCMLVFACTVVSYFFPFTTNDDHLHLEMLLQDKTLDVSNWKVGGNVFFALFAYVVWKLLATALCVNASIPCGVFTPTFVAGAAAGRFIGEILIQSSLFKALIVTDDYPAVFAMTGAAALSAGVTRTVSVIAIVCELTGDVSLGGPVLVSVLFAYFTSRYIAVGFYDLMLHLRQLPCVAGVLPAEVYQKSAEDVMTSDERLIVTAEGSSLLEFFGAFLASKGHSIPIVKSKHDKTVCATISFQEAQKHLRSYRRGVSFGMQHDDEDHAYLDVGIHDNSSFLNGEHLSAGLPLTTGRPLSDPTSRHNNGDRLSRSRTGGRGTEQSPVSSSKRANERGTDLAEMSSSGGRDHSSRGQQQSKKSTPPGTAQQQQRKHRSNQEEGDVSSSRHTNVLDLLSDTSGKTSPGKSSRKGSWNDYAIEEEDGYLDSGDAVSVPSTAKQSKRSNRKQEDNYYGNQSSGPREGGDDADDGQNTKNNNSLKNKCDDQEEVLIAYLKRNYPYQCSLYELQLLRVTNFTPNFVCCDCSPLRVLPSTSTSRLHFMLTMLSLSQVLICDESSKLLGVARSSSLIEAGQRCDRIPFRTSHQQSRGEHLGDDSHHRAQGGGYEDRLPDV
eukprot:Lankesteria_metandrocarpae@DN5113_c0_g1_i2.p1